MNLTWLKTFVTVARRGSLTAAAKELHMTQPGVSRQIQGLEQQVGVALLERSGRAVRLTPAGERFRVYSEDMLQKHEIMLAELRGETVAVQGELRIAASTTPGEFVVPDLVSHFTELHPGVQPDVFISDSAMVLAELRTRHWDVGFVGARPAARGLSFHPIAGDEVMLAVPAAHPFAGRRDVSIDELVDQPFLEREEGSGTLQTVRTALAAQGRSLPRRRTVMVLSTTQAIISAVERGHGIGWVSSLALQRRQAAKVVGIRLAGVSLRRKFYLVSERARPPSQAAAAFLQFVRDATSGSGAWPSPLEAVPT